MHLAPGQAPDEPGVYRTEHELPLIGTVACPRYMIENPFDFRSTEIGIDNQACLLANHIGETLIFQLVAITRRAAILPHDCIVDRFLGIQVPNDCRLALKWESFCHIIPIPCKIIPANLQKHAHNAGIITSALWARFKHEENVSDNMPALYTSVIPLTGNHAQVAVTYGAQINQLVVPAVDVD